MSEDRINRTYLQNIQGGAPYDPEAQMAEIERRNAVAQAARDRIYKMNREAEEKAAKEKAAQEKARHDAMVAERRAEAQAELDAKLEQLHQEYLDAGGQESGWKAFKETKANDLIASQISNRERIARQSFLDYAKGR